MFCDALDGRVQVTQLTEPYIVFFVDPYAY